MSSPSSTPPSISAEEEAPKYELKAFAGLPQALGRLILRDTRSRKEIAAAAQINASMLSGYCSGRRIPSLEHLDRILTTLGVGVEELTYELRALDYRAPSNAPLVVWPKSNQPQESESVAAGALLTVLLSDLRDLLAAQAKAAGHVPASEPARAPKARGKKRTS